MLNQTFFQKVFIKHFIKMLINIFENVPTFFGSTFFLLQHHLRLRQISGGRRGGGGASQSRSRGRARWRASTAVAAGSQAAATSHDAPDEGRTTPAVALPTVPAAEDARRGSPASTARRPECGGEHCGREVGYGG
jgi:hypothetical protein